MAEKQAETNFGGNESGALGLSRLLTIVWHSCMLSASFFFRLCLISHVSSRLAP